MSEINQELLDAVRQAAKEGRITCPEARKVARDLKIAPQVVRQAADELKIKITSCELGCF